MTQRPDDDEEIEDEDKPKAGIFFMAGLIYILKNKNCMFHLEKYIYKH
jgi:hypothetical protein